jgi:hypothetical protein
LYQHNMNLIKKYIFYMKFIGKIRSFRILLTNDYVFKFVVLG